MTDLAWNNKGLLSPISTPLAMDRAPYKISVPELVQRFGTSPERCDILAGFIAYRAELAMLGIVDGFQWVDGSFTENIEAIDNRPPRDIDVVTFYRLPAGETQKTLYNKDPQLFPRTEPEKAVLRQRFYVDGVMSCLDARLDQVIKQVVFFYSLMSHRRDQTWKGFVQVELSQSEDNEALALLNQLNAGTGSQNAI
jgi:hypothetical protein